jgi:dephospho-CoA kinase
MKVGDQPYNTVAGRIRLGLTGGIGCGKSTALKVFREAGVRTVETDAVARALLDDDPTVRTALVQRFGIEMLNAEGKIDRHTVAATVFSDSEALAFLESLLHPRIRDVWMRESLNAEGLIVVEIPLLFEKDLQSHFDVTVCISCDPELQQERLLGRGMNLQQIEQRKQRQLPLSEKARRSDIVISNNGTTDDLRQQIRSLIKQLTSS